MKEKVEEEEVGERRKTFLSRRILDPYYDGMYENLDRERNVKSGVKKAEPEFRTVFKAPAENISKVVSDKGFDFSSPPPLAQTSAFDLENKLRSLPDSRADGYLLYQRPNSTYSNTNYTQNQQYLQDSPLPLDIGFPPLPLILSDNNPQGQSNQFGTSSQFPQQQQNNQQFGMNSQYQQQQQPWSTNSQMQQTSQGNYMNQGYQAGAGPVLPIQTSDQSERVRAIVSQLNEKQPRVAAHPYSSDSYIAYLSKHTQRHRSTANISEADTALGRIKSFHSNNTISATGN